MSENGNGAGPSRAERRAAILGQAGKLATKEATLPGPDGPVAVLVRELTGAQAKDFEVAVAKQASATIGLLLQMSLVDPETKELLFEPADREALESLGIAGLNPVLVIAQELNGLSEADVAKAKAFLASIPSSA